jgi:hypothetical protein
MVSRRIAATILHPAHEPLLRIVSQVPAQRERS